MFAECDVFNQDITTKEVTADPTIHGPNKTYVAWSMSGATDLTYMFGACLKLEQNIPGTWYLKSPVTLTSMFSSAFKMLSAYPSLTATPSISSFTGIDQSNSLNISESFIFKINKTAWDNNPRLPFINSNGSFTGGVRLTVTDSVSDVDVDGNVIITVNYNYNENKGTDATFGTNPRARFPAA